MRLSLTIFQQGIITGYRFLTQLMQVSDINHQLNVNKKYEHLSRIRDGPMVGTGFKKVPHASTQTFAYDCLTTPEELKAKRK